MKKRKMNNRLKVDLEKNNAKCAFLLIKDNFIKKYLKKH